MFEFDWWDVADRLEQSLVVPPVDPSEGGEFDVVDVAPRAAHRDQFGFVEGVDWSVPEIARSGYLNLGH